MMAHIILRQINPVRLSTLLVVSSTEKMNVFLSPFAPEKLVSRDGFDSPVPCQPAHLHTQPESGAYLMLKGFLPSFATVSIYLFETAIGHRVRPEFIGSRNCVPVAFTADASQAQVQ